MAQPIQPQSLRNIGAYGVVRPSSVDDALVPDTAYTEAMNFSFDRIGAATVRPGLTAIGGTAETNWGYSSGGQNPIIGLHNAQSTALLTAHKGVGSYFLFRYPGTSNENLWVSINSGFASTAKVRFVDFSNYTLVMNGTTDSLLLATYPFTNWADNGPPLNPDQFKTTNSRKASFGEVYKSRIYLSGHDLFPSRLYFSSVTDTQGTITWSPGVDYVDINPGDGESITGIKRYSLELLLFKPNYIYRFRTSGLDPDPLIRIGTRSHESMVEGKKGLYFHHDTGFYRYSGGYPIEISRPINDFVEAIPFSMWDDVAGWKDSDHIYWSVGNLTITEDGLAKTWRNVVLRYTESSDVWTVYSYNQDIRRGTTFVSKISSSVVVGLDNPLVAIFNQGATDIGEPIKYRLRTKWYEWEGIQNRKTIDELVTICEKAQASQIFYETDENKKIEPIGELKQMVNFFRNQAIRFNRIRFYIIGISRFEQPVFRGLEILKGTNEGPVYENSVT